MLKSLYEKLKEAMISVLPVVCLVLIVYFTPLVAFTPKELAVFLISAVFLILGIGLFNLGADLAMTPMGEHVGSGLAKTGKLKILLSVCFVMGLLITIAEPDLSVLAGQVSAVMNSTLLIFTVGVGVGLFLLLSIVKIVFKKNLSMLLMFFYMTMFAISSLLLASGKADFLPLAFDSGGVTTGPITVPFIMAMGVGIATVIGGKDANENSFGLIAMCSIGPILAVLILTLTSNGELTYALPDYSIETKLGANLFGIIYHTSLEVARALGLILAFFLILQFSMLKLPRKKLAQIFVGIVYTFLGLVIFLSAVSIGFMPIGFKLGSEMAQNNALYVIIFGFIIGTVVVMAEPAVHVLKKQVEEITGGTVSKRSMLLALSIGVGISIFLSTIRIVFGFSILYYMIPGYMLSLGLSFFVPKLYTAIAFDSGGVASGPLTSSFILPMAMGMCFALRGEAAILSYAFGVVAMVAMTPLITIQILGFRAIMSAKVRQRIAMKRILDADDEQIIYFS
ncbi:MAG: DUF1538 domain-containing protein [Clostridia bacterium]|nr:DUF1538 domain-containing protein [Clostridia bacterium]